jgi:hypothetical protein
MKDLSLNGSAFPTAQCAACGRVVLLHVTLGHDDRECRRCVHCDSEIEATVHWVKAGELEQEGYYFGAPSDRGTGGGCASGGCGTCGSRGH